MANPTDTTARVRVKIATDQQQNSNLAHQLNFYLTNKDMDVTVYPLSSAIKKELEYPNYQWLILALSSDSNSKLANLKETVDYARDFVIQRRLQGVLAITDSPSPDKIANLWPTLRIYDAQNEEAMNEAFDKIYRTLNFTRPSVSTSERRGQVTSLSPQGSTRRVQPRLMIGAAILIAAVLIVAALFGPPDLIHRLSPSPTHISSFTPTPGHLLTQTVSSPSPTSDPTSTAISESGTLYSNTTKSKPTTSYTLTTLDNSSTDWQNDGSSCLFTPKGYNIIASTLEQYVPCMLQNTTYQDFAFQVQMQISPGGAGGLIFRSDKQITKFYRFSVDEQGNYILLLCTECKDQKNDNAQQTLTNDKFNVSNHQYTLTVIVKNNTIYLYIDKTLVYQGQDSIGVAGEIGLYAASTTQSETAVFTAAKIWKL